MLKNSILLYSFILFVCIVNAQESVNASGGNSTGSGGNAAYSIGQVVYTTNTGSIGSEAQGVQHAYEIFTVDIKEEDSHILFTVFPNPTTENLTIQLSEYNQEVLSYQLYDMRGKLISCGQLIEKQTEINTKILPSATYFINITNKENKKLQTLKIIKN